MFTWASPAFIVSKLKALESDDAAVDALSFIKLTRWTNNGNGQKLKKSQAAENALSH